MAFVQKTWKDRVAEYINRRILTKEDGTTELISVERSEGTISQEGDAFSAENMNDLEQRIANEFSEQNKNIPFKFGIDASGNYGYIKDGADSVTPFKKYANLNTGITLTNEDRRRIHNISQHFDRCWALNNSDGTKRVCLAIPYEGYYDSNDVIGIPYSEFKKALGIPETQQGTRVGLTFTNSGQEFLEYITFDTEFINVPSVSLSWAYPSEFTVEARDISQNGFLLYVKWNGYGGPAKTDVTWVATGL